MAGSIGGGSGLDPRFPQAAAIFGLFVQTLIVCRAIFLVVVALVTLCVVRFRGRRTNRCMRGATGRWISLAASPLPPQAGVTAKRAAWLRRTAEQEFVAFSVNCAHLGCPVRWLEGARLFMCPCHGGVYYEDGRGAAGPPPHGLTRYPIRIRDGEVEISTQPMPIG
jgi:nitrite reductase/ring-hydroxylating ferredoxin subunit